MDQRAHGALYGLHMNLGALARLNRTIVHPGLLAVHC